MKNNNKVVWSEGMLLRQQHFQQQERYIAEQIKLSSPEILPDNYGFYNLEIASNLLSLKRFSLINAKGVFPDGTYFIIGDQGNAILQPLVLEENVFDKIIYLCMPLESQLTPKYKNEVYQAQDDNDENFSEAPIVIGKLNLQLRVANDDLSQFITLPVAKIKNSNEKDGILLEENFMFPALQCSAIVKLKQDLEEISGLIEQRIKILAERIAAPNKQYVADLKEWLLLQILSRHHMLWKHEVSRLHQHPIHFYVLTIQLLSELSTFTNPKKYCDFQTEYQQNNLYQTFSPLLNMLHQELNKAIEHTAIIVTLEKTTQGWWQSTALSNELLNNSQLIIAAKADLPNEELEGRFLTQVKVASSDKIPELLGSQLPGLTLESLPTIPPVIPYYAGYLYFHAKTDSDLWEDLKKFGQLAIHATAQFPKLELICWMLRN